MAQERDTATPKGEKEKQPDNLKEEKVLNAQWVKARAQKQGVR